jgi:hypothetical protein
VQNKTWTQRISDTCPARTMGAPAAAY